MLQEFALWLMKFASNLAAGDTVDEPQAKQVYRSLLKAAGLFQLVQAQYFERLAEQPPVGSDLDSRVCNAYASQCLAEAQEGASGPVRSA